MFSIAAQAIISSFKGLIVRIRLLLKISFVIYVPAKESIIIKCLWIFLDTFFKSATSIGTYVMQFTLFLLELFYREQQIPK